MSLGEHSSSPIKLLDHEHEVRTNHQNTGTTHPVAHHHISGDLCCKQECCKNLSYISPQDTMKMHLNMCASAFVKGVSSYQTMQHRITEGSNHHSHHCESLISQEEQCFIER